MRVKTRLCPGAPLPSAHALLNRRRHGSGDGGILADACARDNARTGRPCDTFAAFVQGRGAPLRASSPARCAERAVAVSRERDGDAQHPATVALGGAAAGVVECLVVQPLDMVKTRFQLNQGGAQSIFGTLAAVVREGGVLHLWRGILPEALGMVPKSSAMYSTYHYAKELIGEQRGKDDALTAALAGTTSGVSEAITVSPFQVLKVRLQAREHVGKYKNTADCLVKTVQEEGIIALSRGLGPTLWRNCVWNTVYFGTMFELKRMLPTADTRAGDLGWTLVSGFFGGMIATCFNAPFDMIKSRFQSEIVVPGKPRVHRFTLLSLARVARTEGLAACYKGFTPKLWRMGLGGAVAMATFEAVKSFV